MEDSGGILALAATAAAFGAVHTAANPAHYLPFVAIGKSHGWGLPKILAFAAACGMGHLLSSALVGGLGIAFGAGVGEASFLDAVREDIMKWAFLAFAIVYFFLGLRVSISGRGRMHCCEADSGAKNRRVVGQGELLDIVFDFYDWPVRNTRAPCDGSGF